MKLGAIDPECVSGHERAAEADAATGRQWTWDARCSDMGSDPGALGWQRRNHDHHGLSRRGRCCSRKSRVQFTTSQDPVGAPIFYRDVPLMPSAGANGRAAACRRRRFI